MPIVFPYFSSMWQDYTASTKETKWKDILVYMAHKCGPDRCFCLWFWIQLRLIDALTTYLLVENIAFDSAEYLVTASAEAYNISFCNVEVVSNMQC